RARFERRQRVKEIRHVLPNANAGASGSRRGRLAENGLHLLERRQARPRCAGPLFLLPKRLLEHSIALRLAPNHTRAATILLAVDSDGIILFKRRHLPRISR